MSLQSLISIIINWLHSQAEFEMQQCTGFSSWAVTCVSCSFDIFVCCTRLIPGVETPTFGSTNECPHFVKVCSIRASTNTWALSIWSAGQRAGREDTYDHTGERVSIPSQPRGSQGTPRGTEELATQQVSSGGVVFPGPLSDSELLKAGATAYSSLPCPLYPQ